MHPKIIEFQKSFSDEQKAGIIILLKIVAEADGEYSQNEKEFITKISFLLDLNSVRLQTNYRILENKIIKGGTDFMWNDLQRLSRDQKEWLIFILNMIIYVDEQGIIEKQRQSILFASGIGIQTVEYASILDNGEAMSNYHAHLFNMLLQ